MTITLGAFFAGLSQAMGILAFATAFVVVSMGAE